jgi:pyruvate/2-oxoglutarate dehydrogenase complex dihydrolipoamide dehydrogenase (E3) component
VAAVRAGQLGLKVAIVEKEKDARLGGTCGCVAVSDKGMLNAAHLYQKAGDFEHFG